MKANQLSRLERLEEIAGRWEVDNKVYESFEMENKTAQVNTWSQKVGLKRGKSIEFETIPAALEWVTSQLSRGRAQIYVDDIRDIMTDDDRAIFDALFPNAPDYKVMFDLRNGQDVTAEAVRLWKHFLSGVKYRTWWAVTNAHIEGLLQSIE